MDAGVLNFTPEEYQFLEDVEFDETIERPSAIRFYTLNEQVTDAYEKLVPRGRSTRFQRDQVRKDVDRLQELYETYVSILPDAYTFREPEVSTEYPWVSPVYESGERRAYSWDTQWRPLYENLRAPNFIPRLIADLPRPFVGVGEGTPSYALSTPTEFVTTEGTAPLRGLPAYGIPRTQYHSDKTISIVIDPQGGSGDTVGFKGYFLRKRALDIPNPLPAHPFLKENVDTFVPSTAPLKDVVPSLDAILTHAIPVSKDPYREAMPFLKLWDVKLSSIPWSSWKSKFPPVDLVRDREPPAPIEFPKPSQLSVPEKVQELYGVSYFPGMSVRLWLMNQRDGGGVVMNLLRSMAIDNGSVAMLPAADLPKAAYPESTVEACSLEGKPFAEFVTTGILRRTITGSKITYQCVPLEFIKQERAQAGYRNRIVWEETTGDTMKKEYLKRLAEVTPPTEIVKKEAALAKTPSGPESVRRAEIRAILTDESRYADDKVRDIRKLLPETTLTKNIYLDPEGAFVVCSHTLALLEGDLERDRQTFYDTWTASMNGFRVCRFCGEQINADVFEDADEYDDEGFLIRSAEALEGPGKLTTGVVEYVTGLRDLQRLFKLNTPHDDTVFLILSLLQVLPTADVLDKFLAQGRSIAAALYNKGPADKDARFQGMVGVATAVLLLQTHIPSLVPRRSFGPRPLILSGYPRDTDKPAEFTIVDSLIMVLRKTFEAFPTTFNGPSKALLKGVLNKSGEVKTNVIGLVSAKSPLRTRKTGETFVEEMLRAAKAHVAAQPPVEAPKTLLPVMAPPKEFGGITSFPACPSARPIWTSGRMPRVSQPAVALRGGIQAATGAEPVAPAISERDVPVTLEKDAIRSLLTTGTKLVTRIRVGDEYRTSLLLASRLADMFRQPTAVRTVDPTQKSSELRDIARGLALRELSEIQSVVAKQTQLEERRTKDVALYMLQADPREEKSQANKLRASERLKIVDDLKKKSDTERDIIQQLLAIGAAPYLVTREDRTLFAREAELLQEQMRADEIDIDREREADAELGVGLPRDYEDDGDVGVQPVDAGDYGDRARLPEGRDPAVGSLIGAGAGTGRSI